MPSTILLMLLAAANSSGPLLRADGPCAGQLASALRQERPGQEVATEGPLQENDLKVSLEPLAQGQWRLEVTGGDGGARLSRPLAGASCADASDPAAVIVERYLVSISWRGAEASLEPLVAPDAGAPWPTLPVHPVLPPVQEVQTPPESKTSIAPVVDAGIVGAAELVETPPPSPPWFRHPEVTAGPAMVWGNSQLLPAVSIEASLRVRKVRAGLWFGGSSTQSQDITVPGEASPRGQLMTQYGFAYASASGCTFLGSFEACGGGAAGAAFAYGTVPKAGSRVYQTQGQLLAPPALAAVGRLSYAWPWGLEVALQALVGVPLVQPAFAVENYQGNTASFLKFPVPGVEAVGALHAGWSFQ